MSKIKLPHASGNSMSIAAPATNPASDLELKLPATIGSANEFLKNSGTAGTLEYSSLVEDSSGNVGIGTSSPAQPLHVKGLCRFETTNSTNHWVNYTHTDNTYRFNYNGAGNDEIVIYSDGSVTKPANPSADVYLSGNSAVGGAGTKISSGDVAVFNATRWNIGSHYNTSNGRFTCPVAGIYQVKFETNLILTNLSVGHYFQISTMKNGSRYYDNYDIRVLDTTYQNFGFVNYVQCAASDYLDIRFSSTSNNTFGADSSVYYNAATFTLIQ